MDIIKIKHCQHSDVYDFHISVERKSVAKSPESRDEKVGIVYSLISNKTQTDAALNTKNER